MIGREIGRKQRAQAEHTIASAIWGLVLNGLFGVDFFSHAVGKGHVVGKGHAVGKDHAENILILVDTYNV